MRQQVDKVNQPGATPSAAAVDAAELMETVHRVMHRFRALQYRELQSATGASGELTHMEGKVLGFFAAHPGATQRELADHSGRDKGQLARLVARLRELGLLDAEPDPADRRSVRLTLTAAGARVQAELKRRVAGVSAVAVDGMSAAQRATLLALLQRVDANLSGAQDDDARA